MIKGTAMKSQNHQTYYLNGFSDLDLILKMLFTTSPDLTPNRTYHFKFLGSRLPCNFFITLLLQNLLNFFKFLLVLNRNFVHFVRSQAVSKLKTVMQKGLETLRCMQNHGIDPRILIYISLAFWEKVIIWNFCYLSRKVLYM